MTWQMTEQLVINPIPNKTIMASALFNDIANAIGNVIVIPINNGIATVKAYLKVHA